MGGLLGTAATHASLPQPQPQPQLAQPQQGTGVLETVTRIQQLGGDPVRADRVLELRARFETGTGAFASEDSYFEARSRAFWCDAIARSRFGRDVEAELTAEERAWLGPLERAHRGLFRVAADVDGPAGPTGGASAAGARSLVDVWSGAEFEVTVLDDESSAELDAGSGQLFDARVVVSEDARTVALLPGAVFHPREATAPIDTVLAAARDRALSTDDTLDALLRMERSLRSLSRVKAAYAYRPEALSPALPTPPRHPPDAADRLRRIAKSPT
jgi:hypothetical protein